MSSSKVILTSAAIAFNDNKVLLVKHTEQAGHKTGVYGLPCGRIEEGEATKDAAIRELKEETGLMPDLEEVVEYPNNMYQADIERKNGETKTFQMQVFIVKKYTGLLHESEETIPEWIPLDKLDTHNLLPNVKKAILDAKQYLENNE